MAKFAAAMGPRRREPGMAEQRCLGPAQGTHFGLAQVRLARHEELIELGRLHMGAGKHGMDLAAVMHLMIDQMRDHMAAQLALHPAFAAIERDNVVERRRVEAADMGDESVVGHRLRPRQVGHRTALRRLTPLPLHVSLAVQRGEVVEIDCEYVVECRGKLAKKLVRGASSSSRESFRMAWCSRW